MRDMCMTQPAASAVTTAWPSLRDEPVKLDICKKGL